MRKTVLVTTCDQCGTDDVADMPRVSRRARLLLPPRWLHVTGSTATAEVFSLDMCPACVDPVLKVAGAYGR